jgi:hypothetical protein
MHGLASALLDRAGTLVLRPDALITVADLRRFDELSGLHSELHAEADRLYADAGAMNFARHPPPYCRRRGDPPDVPVTPPDTSDLGALRRWVHEWQVREGRREPRTRRERALAKTGARERAKLAAVGSPDQVRFFPRLPRATDEIDDGQDSMIRSKRRAVEVTAQDRAI